MTTEYNIGELTRDEFLYMLGLVGVDDPKVAALAALSWGGAALKVVRVTAAEDNWELHALVKADVGLGSVDNTADAAKNVLTATKLLTARAITLSGDGAWTVNFDGSAGVSAALTLATVNPNVGSFGGAGKTLTATANGKGLVTAIAETSIAITASQVTDFNEAAQDAIGLMVDSSLVYVDATPLLTRAALTGDVTASQGSNAMTIAAGAVTLAKQANMATSSVVYRKTAGSGAPEVQTLATLKTDLGLTGTNSGDQTITLTGNVTGSGTGSFATTIAAGAVTLAMQANMATASVVYRKTAGSGAPEVQTLATLKTDLGLTGTNSGDQTITLTGDATGSGTGSFATTLATVNANVGAFGSATQVGTFTVDAKGRTTAAANVTITPAASSITGGAALTRTDDTNVTLTLGGTPASALLAAASLTLGWTGILAAARGGTANGFTAFTGPATATKTFTLPNASDTVGCLGQTNLWTGLQRMKAGSDAFRLLDAAPFLSFWNAAESTRFGYVLANGVGDMEIAVDDAAGTVKTLVNGNVIATHSSTGVAVTGAFAATGTVAGSNITSGGNTTGNSATTTKWATGRTITTTGDATGVSGALDGSANLSFALTIPAGTVTLAKMADVATARIIGRTTAGTGVPEALTAAQVRSLLSLVVGTDVQAYDAHLTTWSGITPGSGVGTALAVNIGSAGAFVTFNGAGGTPSSLTLTNATGLPIGSGVSGLAAGIATFLATPSSANLIAAVTDETGTGALVFGTTPTLATPVINGIPTGTGVSITSTVSTLALRTTNGLLAAVNFISDYTTVATAAGTTTLTVGSTFQQYFTGSSTQTVTLPVASTLTLGHQFLIVNNSTGAVTVNSSGGNAVIVLAGGSSAQVTCILASGTSAASWSTAYFGDAVASGKKLTVSNTLTLTGTDGSSIAFGTGGTVLYSGGALGTPASGNLANCTFPTLNQNTSGSAATLTTSRNIDGQTFNGSADITVLAPGTHAATSKTTPVDADELPLVDSAAANVLKKLTWANLKATLKTYFDTLYQAVIAAPTQNALTLNTGWSNFGGAYQTAIYSKSVDGLVKLGGLVTGSGANYLIATLPAGYRPSAKRPFPVVNGTGAAWGSVDSAGLVTLESGNNATYVSLDGISFYV